MKNIFQLILSLFFIFNLSSCYTTEKLTVYGKPGTEIYTPYKEKLSEINSDGKAKVVLSSDGCYTYLLSKDANSNLYIPFALDYKNKSYIGTKMLIPLNGAIVLGGLTTAIVSGIAAGEDDAPLALVGLAAIPASFVGTAASMRLNQTTRQWQFKYLNTQETNSDINFTCPVFSEPFKKIEQSEPLSEQQIYDKLAATGWEQKQNDVIKLPFKEGTFEVLQIVTHFNGDNITMESNGKVCIKGNSINISIPKNKFLKDKIIKITKDLKRNKRFGKPERTYKLYQTSDGNEIGIYIDDDLEAIGIIEQKILISVGNSVYFEIAWM